MKNVIVIIPLTILLVLAFALEDADGRGRRPGGPPRPAPGGNPGSTGSGGGSGGSQEAPPREAPSTPGKIDGEDSTEKGADTKERPKKPEDALRDEITAHIQKTIGDCIARSANGLVRRAFRGAQKGANRKAGDCPVAEHPAEEPPAEKEKPEPEEEQKSE